MQIAILLWSIILTAPVVVAGDTGLSFERILVPTIADTPVPGAFGSQWVTEITGRYVGPFALPLFFPVCSEGITCLLREIPAEMAFGSEVFFHSSNAPHGAVLTTWPDRAKDTLISARVRDLSRGFQTWGTELPIVRESDVTGTPIEFLNVPNSDRFRLTIRMYDFRPLHNAFVVTILPLDSDEVLSEFIVPGTPMNEYLYFAVVTELFLPSATPERVRVVLRTLEPTKFWAVAAVTNNETQHVTIISPTRAATPR